MANVSSYEWGPDVHLRRDNISQQLQTHLTFLQVCLFGEMTFCIFPGAIYYTVVTDGATRYKERFDAAHPTWQ